MSERAFAQVAVWLFWAFVLLFPVTPVAIFVALWLGLWP